MRSSRPSSSALALALAVCSSGCDEPADDAAQLQRGRELYGEYCALCHGEEGEGYTADAANALSNQDFLSIATDDFIRRGIDRGRPGTPMSGWGHTWGGPLQEADLDAMVALIRSWQTVEDFDLSQISVGDGEALRGEAVYAVYCEDCHGEEGGGGTFMSVSNPEFLANADDRFLAHSIRVGRRGTSMIGYESELTNQNIDDVVALLRSWEKPVDDEPCELPSKDIAGAFVNPDGDAADFPAEGRYVSVADVFAAYDAGAKMMILDARPPCDYVKEHIAGAVSVPFYDGEAYLDQLSQDDWIVTYCACPHAEAGALADVLLGAGFTRVKVLDEGLPGWLEMAYPTE